MDAHRTSVSSDTATDPTVEATGQEKLVTSSIVSPEAVTQFRIELKNLDIYYSDFLAVQGVSLQVRPQSVMSFIGPSGCGKSTVLRSIDRMHEVTPGARVSGQVLLDGEDIYAPNVDPVLVRRTIGMVFQRPNPFPTMSIYDNVIAGLKLEKSRGVKKSSFDDTVERSLQGANLWDEVKDRLDRPGAGLSGGQQQRLCIARAIAVEPEVLLMDEPFGALDAQTRLMMQENLLSIWSEFGITVVFVTHDVDESIFLADRVLIMSASPGSVIDDLNVTLPRPRDPAMATGSEFMALKKICLDQIRAESLRAFEQQNR